MDIDVILSKLQTICSKQEKCPADIIHLLNKWGVGKERHQNIIDKLKSDKFVDEYRFATAYVRDKIKIDHWGLIKIKIYLKQKGIDSITAELVLKEIDREEYRQMIENELLKKRKTLKGSPYEVWGKLARYGSSRGYEMELMETFLKNNG